MKKTAPMASMLTTKRTAMAGTDTEPTLVSTGTTAIIGTTARSWKSRMPKDTRPGGESTSFLSDRSFMTTAVLLSEMRKP